MVQRSRCKFYIHAHTPPGVACSIQTWNKTCMLMNCTPMQQPTTPANESAESKKASSKVTKAQRRAQQAEFNRQLWAEAYVLKCNIICTLGNIAVADFFSMCVCVYTVKDQKRRITFLNPVMSHHYDPNSNLPPSSYPERVPSFSRRPDHHPPPASRTSR